MENFRNKTFVGVIVDNNDPKKLGRCRVRVLNVFDEIPVEDIPWATPWKDLNGNALFVPDIGKVVSVVFDTGNIYKPEYIYAEHFNANLEKKLQQLSGSNYTSMRALMFDHKTQIYSNDGEGLKIDYKFNNINITDYGIDLNLKDNVTTLNLGTPTANQQAILGNHFLEWFDEFVHNLMSKNAGPYLAVGAPVVPNPEFVRCLRKYQELRDDKFLSHHVKIVDNDYVVAQQRIAEGQIGDSWRSTKEENSFTSQENVDYSPSEARSTDNPTGTISPSTNGQNNPSLGTGTPPAAVPTENPDIDRIFNAMRKKNYIIYEKPYQMNIVGIRRQYEGMKYSNKFLDDCYLIYKEDNGKWISHKYKITTMPGFYYGDEDGSVIDGEKAFYKVGVEMANGKIAKSKINNKQSQRFINRGGLGMLRPSQMIDTYYLGEYFGPALRTSKPQPIYKDKTPGDTIVYSTGKTSPDVGGACYFHTSGNFSSLNVDNWSEGCQVFSSKSELKHFMDLCKKHTERHANSFTYTLMEERDLENPNNLFPPAPAIANTTVQNVSTQNADTNLPNSNATSSTNTSLTNTTTSGTVSTTSATPSNTQSTSNGEPVDPQIGIQVQTSSLKGYKYYKKKTGPFSEITVKDGEGKVIFKGSRTSSPEKILLQEAKLATNDYDPNKPIEQQV